MKSAEDIAESLFIANWKLQSGFTDEHLVEQCRKAAEALCASRPKSTAKKKASPKAA